MTNDKPTSLRMGFGYHQARAAGLDGLRQDRSPRQVNKITKENKSFRGAVADLRKLRDDPDWRPFIEYGIDQGMTPEKISEEIHRIDRFAWARIKRKFRLEYCLKRYWPS